MGRLLILVVMIGAAVGWMLSAAPQGEAKPPLPEPTILVEAPSSTPLPAPDDDRESLTLARESDGHFYADVRVNNVPLRFLVDTGASGIALTRDDARRAGLAVSAGMFDVVGKGASGDVRGEPVVLDHVAMGKAEVRHSPAIILDSGEQSLLGQSFLRQFTVEISGDTMRLR